MFKHKNKVWLKQKYGQESLSLRRFNIQVRTSIEAKKLVNCKGTSHQDWNGGRFIGKRGYMYLNVKYLFDCDCYYPGKYRFDEHDLWLAKQTTNDWRICEHRLFMAIYLDRPLKPKEVVHHKGDKYPLGSIENRQDNRIENLRLFDNNGEHQKHEWNLNKKDKQLLGVN